MAATAWMWGLIAIPGRLVRHGRQLILRLPAAATCLPRSSPARGPPGHVLTTGPLARPGTWNPRTGRAINRAACLPAH